jgi:hypothetical protein
VIRARPGKAPHGDWHWHDVDVQFVYVLKGSAVFEYEGIGRVTMKAGTCFYQPPRIRHREIRHSRDLQMSSSSRRRNSGLTQRRNLQPEGHRPVVDEADLHVGAESAGDGAAFLREVAEQPFPVGG